MLHFLRRSTNLLSLSFSKILLTTEGTLTEWYFLAVCLSPTFLNTWTRDEIFDQFGKQDSSRHVLKSAVSKCQNSGS